MGLSFRQLLLATVLASAVSGCGGGDGSGSNSTPPTSTAPPTAPLPPTTPAPPPTATYVSPADYTASFSLTSTIGYAADRFIADNATSAGLGVYLLPEDQSSSLAYTAQPEGLRFAYAGAEAEWTGAERQCCATQRYYRRGDELIGLGFTNGISPTYVTEVTWQSGMGAMTLNGVSGRRARLSVAIIGSATVPSELPTDNTVSYQGAAMFLGGLQSDQFTNRVESRINFTLRFGATVSGIINVYDSAAATAAEMNIPLAFTGQLDRSTGILTGTVANTGNTLAGTFRGQLFGPSGKEVAITFKAQRSTDRAELVGTFVGSR